MRITDKTFDWNNYYNITSGRDPRPILLKAVELFPTNFIGIVADIGFGVGNEVIEMIKRGWQVLAIDQESNAIDRLNQRISSSQLKTVVSSFEELELPNLDLIHASYSLPFCHPEYFNDLWEKIKLSLKPNGVFAGHLFGINDEWRNNEQMTFHNREEVERLLSDFSLVEFEENEGERKTATGKMKYWHTFDIIARIIS